MNLQTLKPSITTLPYLQQKTVHERIRVSRLITKVPKKKSIVKKVSAKQSKLDTLKNISPAEAQRLLAKLSEMKDLPDNIANILKGGSVG